MATFVLAAAAAFVLLITGCAGGGSGPVSPGSVPAPTVNQAAIRALATAQASLEAGYTVVITAGGLVLPGFGPIDAGTVKVASHGAAAQAQVRRSGDTATWALVFVDGATYFRRAGCEAFSRLPDGAHTFDALLFPFTNALRDGQKPHLLEAGSRVVVDTTITGLGESLVQADREDGHLVTIVFGDQPDNAGHIGFTFDFSDLGEPLDLVAPPGAAMATPAAGAC